MRWGKGICDGVCVCGGRSMRTLPKRIGQDRESHSKCGGTIHSQPELKQLSGLLLKGGQPPSLCNTVSKRPKLDSSQDCRPGQRAL